MTGLVYKEWKQNRWFILAMILCGALPVLIVLKTVSDDMSNISLARNLGMIIAFLSAGGLQTMVMRGDDRKQWGYWITATSEGYRGFLRVKYEMIFGMVILFLISLQTFDGLFCAVAADKGITEIEDISSICVTIIFFQLLLRAIDIPFTLRYGNKKGSIIKLIYSVAFTLIFFVLLFLNIGDISVKLYEAAEKLFSGEVVSLTFGAFSVLVLAAYYTSYRISCMLYLKGGEDYDK